MNIDVEDLARVLGPQIEAVLIQIFESDPQLLGVDEMRLALETDDRLLGVPETRRAFDEPSLLNSMENEIRGALEANEEFMAEVERLRREGSEN